MRKNKLKLTKELISEIKKLTRIENVLEVGFGYPYLLFELKHNYNAETLYGIELEKEASIVSCSTICDAIAKEINTTSEKSITSEVINSLIKDDEDPEREIHNSYRLYTTFILKKEPLQFKQFKEEFKLIYEKNIVDFLQKEPPKPDKHDSTKYDVIHDSTKYDVIIASKVLSHIAPKNDDGTKSMYDSGWVEDRLLEKLTDKGIIFLRLNTDHFKVDLNTDANYSTIKAPYDAARLAVLREKLDIISEVPPPDTMNSHMVTPDKKERHIEIIARRKIKHSGNE